MVKTEGRIGQYAVKLLKLTVMDKYRLAESVLPDDLELLCPVEKQIHPRNGRGREVFLLTLDLAVGGLFIIHVADGFDQHTAGSASGVINRFTGLGLQQTYH